MPEGDLALRQWLAGRGLGLVPVADPAAFAWPGRFLARTAAAWQVRFGVPPGVVLDPAGAGPGIPDAAAVLAAHDPARRPAAAPARPGRVELVALAPAAEAPMRRVSSARALPGRGLEGDRYAAGAGTFSAPGSRGSDLTLVEGEALDALRAEGVVLQAADARRNLVVRGIALDGLIGRRFRVGQVECLGQRRCEPCAHLERLTAPGVLRGLVHRGGLRADVVAGGVVRAGDEVVVLS